MNLGKFSKALLCAPPSWQVRVPKLSLSSEELWQLFDQQPSTILPGVGRTETVARQASPIQRQLLLVRVMPPFRMRNRGRELAVALLTVSSARVQDSRVVQAWAACHKERRHVL